jgi:hypothetical protein
VDVVDHENIDVPEAVAELGHLTALNTLQELGDETFAGGVIELGAGIVFDELEADGLKKVCLAEAHPAVDEEGVVLAAGVIDDRESRGEGEFVAGTFDEGVEGIVGVNGEGFVGVGERIGESSGLAGGFEGERLLGAGVAGVD